MAVCKGCRAPIIWARTKADKLMPLDMEPSPDRGRGTYAIRGGVTGDSPYAVPVTEAETAEPVYMNHWTTCEKRSQFKKDKT